MCRDRPTPCALRHPGLSVGQRDGRTWDNLFLLYVTSPISVAVPVWAEAACVGDKSNDATPKHTRKNT